METRNIAREHDYMESLRLANDNHSSGLLDRMHKGQILWLCGERVRNCFARSGILSDYEVLKKTENELLQITMLGKLSVETIKTIYGQFGYELAKD